MEQNGSKVLFLWRVDEFGTVGVSVAKNRRGRQGVVQMSFDGAHQKFTELSEPYREPEKNAAADFGGWHMNIGGEKKEKMVKIQILWRRIYDYLGSVQHSKINQARAL